MEIQNLSNGTAHLTFEALSDTETKAIVTRGGETYKIRVLHASPKDIEEFKQYKEELLNKKEGENKETV